MANAVHKLLEKAYVIDLFHCFSSAEHNRKAAGQIPSLIQINDGGLCACFDESMVDRCHNWVSN